MKIIRVSMLILFNFVTFVCLSSGTFAQDYTQVSLLEGAKFRLGTGRAVDIAYSPDGKQFAVATPIGIWIYDSRTGKELNMLIGHTNTIKGIAYSPDGRTLASGSVSGLEDTIRLWDTTTGRHKATLTGIAFGVYSIAFSPDGETLATGSYEYIQLWDVVSGERKLSFVARTERVVDIIAFSPDGSTLASVDDNKIALWDATTGTHKTTLTGQEHVHSIAFSPDGSTLASGQNNTITLWDATSGAHKTTSRERGAHGQVAFSPDGSTLASGFHGNKVRLWDVHSGQQHEKTFTGLPVWISRIVFSPDGNTIAINSDAAGIRLLDLVSSTYKTAFTDHMTSVSSIALSPDGDTIASGSSDSIVRLWDVVSGSHKTTLTGHTDVVNSVAFSPDGNTIASGSRDKTVRLWDTGSGSHKTTLTGHTDVVNSVAFSPDGNTIASGGSDSTVRLWDAVSGSHKTTLTGHTDVVNSVAFSPDGDTIASGSRDKTVRLWDAGSGQHQRTLTGYTNGVFSVAFNPDGKTIAGGTAEYYVDVGKMPELSLRDAITGEYKGGKKGFWNPVKFAFSPDGQTLATETKMGQQVMLWEAATGVVKTTFPWHSHYFTDFAFSPDGKTLITGTQDGFIILWEIAPDLLQPSGQVSVTIPPLSDYPPRVRLVYFFPNDQASQPNIDTELHTLIEQTQEFFADQMESHGFSRKTFEFETDANGKAVVHPVQGGGSAKDYINRTISVQREVEDLLDPTEHIYLVVLDRSINGALGSLCGLALTSGRGTSPGTFQMTSDRRFAIVQTSGSCAGVGVSAHELGHTFGLAHDLRDKAYVMNGSGESLYSSFSYAAAQWLDVHPFLNPGQPKSENHTTIEELSLSASRLRFRVADADGLHQAQLIVDDVRQRTFCGTPTSMHGSQALNNVFSTTLEFGGTQFSSKVDVRIIDIHGNISSRGFPIQATTETTEPSQLPADVNGDGVVNIIDLTLVASNFGKTGTDAADVNRDGVVNIIDLTLVAAAFGNTAAAPIVGHYDSRIALTRAEVAEWLREARHLNVADPTVQRGILMLEQLLASLTPKETALLANYPNPFNPETWIPYQLAAPADVRISIYAADGALVRTLDLGNQAVGMYQTRSHAAYWDGKNAFGEPVASGVYFYTLIANDFTNTRKMLIRK